MVGEYKARLTDIDMLEYWVLSTDIHVIIVIINLPFVTVALAIMDRLQSCTMA